jgi:phosphomannomutase
MEYNSIFKRYDIRGKYPEEINEETAKILAGVYFDIIKPTKVVIGYDNVQGSDSVCEEFGLELSRLGCAEVISVGMVPTPVLYYACSHLVSDHALMFTASHLGEGYTGVKPLKFGIPLPEETMLQIRDNYLTRTAGTSISTVSMEEPAGAKINAVSIVHDYTEALLKLVGKNLSRYKVVVDAGNGPVNSVLGGIFDQLDINYSAINTHILAKNFSHPSNPKIKQNRHQLEEAIREQKSDLGIIWDGDCDRCLFVDSAGDLISPEFVAIVIASYLQRVSGCRKITADVRASSAVEIECARAGIEVKRIKAWHVPIKEEMEKDPNIGFGFEVSGHYIFRDFYKIDDGLLAAVSFLDGLQNSEISLKEMLEDFRQKYYIPEEINYRTEVSEEMLQNTLKNKYKDGVINLIDGISVDYPNWRFNVRSSRTEPIIRLNISGSNKQLVSEQLDAIEKEIGGTRL